MANEENVQGKGKDLLQRLVRVVPKLFIARDICAWAMGNGQWALSMRIRAVMTEPFDRA